MEVDVHLKQGGYLPVENNPELAQDLMVFFRNREAVNLIDAACDDWRRFWLSFK